MQLSSYCIHIAMIKIGIVGANELGKRHIKQLEQMPVYSLVGFYDHSESIAQAFASENKLTHFAQMI